MIKARFGPFISAGFDHVTQMLFIGRLAAAEWNIWLLLGCKYETKKCHFCHSEFVISDMKCSAV